MLQLPHAAVLLERSAQTVPQFTWPVGHAQMPATQLDPLGHVRPHPPQLLGSVCSPEEHVMPPEADGAVVWPAAQEQLPLTQVPAPHEWPHAPQLAVSLARLTHELPHATSEPVQTVGPVSALGDESPGAIESPPAGESDVAPSPTEASLPLNALLFELPPQPISGAATTRHAPSK